MQYTMKRDLWMSNVDWYNPKLHYANFIVLDSQPGFMIHWEPRALIRSISAVRPGFITPAPTPIMVWNRNLLNSIPR